MGGILIPGNMKELFYLACLLFYHLKCQCYPVTHKQELQKKNLYFPTESSLGRKTKSFMMKVRYDRFHLTKYRYLQSTIKYMLNVHQSNTSMKVPFH